MNFLETTKKHESAILIATIVVGIICLFYEVLRWQSQQLLDSNLKIMQGEVAAFQTKFLSRADEMEKKSNEMRDHWRQREESFDKKFNISPSSNSALPNAKIHTQQQVELDAALSELFNYKTHAQGKNTEEKYTALIQLVDRIHRLRDDIARTHADE